MHLSHSNYIPQNSSGLNDLLLNWGTQSVPALFGRIDCPLYAFTIKKQNTDPPYSLYVLFSSLTVKGPCTWCHTQNTNNKQHHLRCLRWLIIHNLSFTPRDTHRADPKIPPSSFHWIYALVRLLQWKPNTQLTFFPINDYLSWKWALTKPSNWIKLHKHWSTKCFLLISWDTMDPLNLNHRLKL